MILSLLAGLLFGSVGYYSVLTWSSASLAFFLVSASCIIGKILQNTSFWSNNISSLFFAPIYQLLFYILFLAVLQNPVETAIQNSKTSVVIFYCRGFFFHYPAERVIIIIFQNSVLIPLCPSSSPCCRFAPSSVRSCPTLTTRPAGRFSGPVGPAPAARADSAPYCWSQSSSRCSCGGWRVTWSSEASRSSEHGASPDCLRCHGPANTVRRLTVWGVMVQRTRCVTRPSVASRSSEHGASPDCLRRHGPANTVHHQTVWGVMVQRTRCVTRPSVVTRSSEHGVLPDYLRCHGPANTVRHPTVCGVMVQRTRCATQPTVASRSSKHCASPDRLWRRVPANMALPLIDGGKRGILLDCLGRCVTWPNTQHHRYVT